ncbi:hypothetical protein ON010_g303 [Phytophthora cinnamomi]|nr:hypothetical protein ON010_g303 [Phytophthora cinnamomi]
MTEAGRLGSSLPTPDRSYDGLELDWRKTGAGAGGVQNGVGGGAPVPSEDVEMIRRTHLCTLCDLSGCVDHERQHGASQLHEPAGALAVRLAAASPAAAADASKPRTSSAGVRPSRHDVPADVNGSPAVRQAAASAAATSSSSGEAPC